MTVKIDDCSFTVSTEILKDILAGKGPINSILALGYAGWGPGQLEKEIVEDGWLVSDPDDRLIFTEKHDKKWNLGINKLGINLSKFSMVGGQA